MGPKPADLCRTEEYIIAAGFCLPCGAYNQDFTWFWDGTPGRSAYSCACCTPAARTNRFRGRRNRLAVLYAAQIVKHRWRLHARQGVWRVALLRVNPRSE